jgi:bifunctional non-homologous end joining protein LigD
VTCPPTPTTGPLRPSGTARGRIAYISGGTAVLRGRSGSDVTSSYPEVAAALTRAAGRRTLILDGELTAFGDERPSFALLQRRLHVARPAPSLIAAVPVTFIAFDLLWQASRSLLRSPYAQRRALLDGLGLAVDHLSVPPAFPGQAQALTDASRDLGLEGVVLIYRSLLVPSGHGHAVVRGMFGKFRS